jgi:molybdopterin/thiamine biosynthesis adenylyltransferase/proteasome lid subunit RPN8/RPN11
MKYTLTFYEKQYQDLVAHLFPPGLRVERVAFLLCGISRTEGETRLIVREAITLADSELLEQSSRHVSIDASSFLPILKRAHIECASFVLVHSHPPGLLDHSQQDNSEELGLFWTAYNRTYTANAVHASLVFSDPELPRGRVWLDGGKCEPIDLVRVIGRRFTFYPRTSFDRTLDTSFHDREVRAFGPDILPLLKSLTIGVVGAGGTGSAVFEQLVRLGVGKLLVSDGQRLESSNVSRVYGSSADDVSVSKSDLMSKMARHIKLGTIVEHFDKPVTYSSVMRRFRECDVIFGCTDDAWGRSLLTRFSLEYCVPVIDMGVKINSHSGRISAISGRITTLLPGKPCLYCRQQITAEDVQQQILQELSPRDAEKQRREGYIPELLEAEPAVIPFTTATAAFAVAEFLQRLTGFKGEDYDLGELVLRFDETVLRTPGSPMDIDCFCSDASLVGKGDRFRLLDQTWRPE